MQSTGKRVAQAPERSGTIAEALFLRRERWSNGPGRPTLRGVITRWLDALAQRPASIPALAALLCAPALLGGVELDDLFHHELARSGDLLTSAFTFVGEHGRAQHLARADLPWWAEPGLRIDLFRPVAALTHLADAALWPAVPWAMHLHSVLWYVALVVLVAAAHRPGLDARRATLATLVFAVSQAHGMNVGWVAARNSLVGAALGVAAFLAHRAWRTRGEAWRALPGPLLFALAVLANQGAVAMLGYFLAFALVLDRRPGRLVALAPYGMVVIAWRAWSALEGYGAAHSGMYVEPTHAPLEYLTRTLVHSVLLLAARFGVAVVDGLGALPGAYGVAFLAALPFLAWIAWRVRARAREDAEVRAWALGTLGTLFTAGALVPTDRNLLVIGVGASIVIADLIVTGLGETRAARALALTLLVLHVPLSAVLLPLRVGSSGWVQSMVDPIEAAIPRDPSIVARSVVIVGAPSDLGMLYNRVLRERRGGPVPARIQYLYAGPGALTLERRAEDVIALRSSAPWLAAPLDRMFRAEVSFALGERVEGECFDAVVEALEDELPSAVRFELHGRGERCTPVFMAWDGPAPRTIELPAIGESIALAPAVLPAE